MYGGAAWKDRAPNVFNILPYPWYDTLTLPLIYYVARDRLADTAVDSAREIFPFNLLSGEFETLQTLLRGNTHNGHQISAF